MYPASDYRGGFVNPVQGSSPFSGIAAEPPPERTLASSQLRVVVAERFRVAPPVPAPRHQLKAHVAADTGSMAGAGPPVSSSFKYERRVLDELEGRRSPAAAPAENGLPQQQDRYEALLSQCVSNGCSREDAALGLAVAIGLQRERTDSHAVLEAARKVRRMREMGFAPNVAAGALAARGGELDAAIDMASV